MTHSPLPWHVEDDSEIRSSDGLIVVHDDGYYSCRPENATFIVRAVNAHATLVAALEKAVELMHTALIVSDAEYKTFDSRHDDAIELEAAIAKSEAALELVRNGGA